jgi:hypothetical protein
MDSATHSRQFLAPRAPRHRTHAEHEQLSDCPLRPGHRPARSWFVALARRGVASYAKSLIRTIGIRLVAEWGRNLAPAVPIGVGCVAWVCGWRFWHAERRSRFSVPMQRDLRVPWACSVSVRRPAPARGTHLSDAGHHSLVVSAADIRAVGLRFLWIYRGGSAEVTGSRPRDLSMRPVSAPSMIM